MTQQQIDTTKEALEVLKLAAEYFDQAGALLKDAGLYTDGVTMPMTINRHDFTARDLNEKLMPKLMEYVGEAVKESGESCDPMNSASKNN